MLFNSFDFLYFFPPAVLVYYVLAHRFRWMWLLACSYFFYAFLEPGLLVLLLASTLLDYFCGIKMEGSENATQRKRYVWISIVGNLGMLFFFKYFAFFGENTRAVLEYFGISWFDRGESGNYVFNQILLPVGISFYTFQTLSYSIDVYRRQIPAVRDLGRYALYVAFFPQLVAGPIERAERLLPQFYKKVRLNLEEITIGITMMAWGFFLKLVVADRLGVYVDEVFLDPSRHKGLPLLTGSLFFAFQIYYDFSAYCTIGVGAARIMGFELMQNFNRPFFFTSVSDFWRRWHISLMLWFKDYVYQPLVTRFGLPKAVAALLVFFFNGLWHGANWTFVVWGLICGLMMLIEIGTKSWRRSLWTSLGVPTQSSGWKFLSWLFVFLCITTSLIFFRSPNVPHALLYIKNMVMLPSTFVNVIYDRTEIWISLGLILLVQFIHYYKGNDRIYELVRWRKPWVRWLCYVGYILVIVLFSVNRQNNFIYFQF